MCNYCSPFWLLNLSYSGDLRQTTASRADASDPTAKCCSCGLFKTIYSTSEQCLAWFPLLHATASFSPSAFPQSSLSFFFSCFQKGKTNSEPSYTSILGFTSFIPIERDITQFCSPTFTSFPTLKILAFTHPDSCNNLSNQVQ